MTRSVLVGLCWTLSMAACGGSSGGGDGGAAMNADSHAAEQSLCKRACACSGICTMVFQGWLGPATNGYKTPVAFDTMNAAGCEAGLDDERTSQSPLRLYETDECLRAIELATCAKLDWGMRELALEIPSVCYPPPAPPPPNHD